MRYEPMNYESINAYDGTYSPTGKVQYDQTTAYFWRCLYHRLMSIIDFKLPDGWNANYFKNVLFGVGYIAVIETAEYGIIPQICTVSGYGIYLQPTKILVAQPLVKFEGRRGENCEVIHLTPDWVGVLDILDHYAYELATAYTSVNVSLVNSRAGLLAYAKNKNAAEALKIIAEKLSAGDPLVIVDKVLKTEDINGEEPLFTMAFDPARNYITDKLLADMTTIMNEFDREIGIPIVDDKKERRIETEVMALTSDAGCRLDVWSDCLTESINNVQKVFPGISISFKVKGVNENVTDTETDDDRTL